MVSSEAPDMFLGFMLLLLVPLVAHPIVWRGDSSSGHVENEPRLVNDRSERWS